MDIERIRKDLENKIDKVNKIKADNKMETKRGDGALKNIYYEEEKEKSFGPVTNELKNIVNAVNEVKEINIKTDEDIQKMLVPYKKPALLRLNSENDKFTPISPIRSPLDTKSPIKKNMPPSTKNTIVLGPITSKYLPRINDSVFGIYYNTPERQYMIGKDVVNFKDDNLIINGKIYEGTEGLFRLLVYPAYATPNFYTQKDFDNYKDILIQTDSMYQNNDKGAGNVESSKRDKYMKMISGIWDGLPENIVKKEKKKLPKEIENDLQVEDGEKEGGGLKK
ncbi:hypothetical protein AGLY_017825 [Aphis glycines]|uniref:DUF8207 domain-containing protein n=1 Tax=Aphis glycines TaxID=307491 RepID=A0A6G0SUY3_APHGL|nr:hypothetical protein AGLY_017825 [Aphis glycines]